MKGFWLGFFTELASVINGTINGAMNTFVGLLKTSYNAVVQYNQEGIALARQMGLNAREAQSYTTTLIKSAKELGIQYGVDAKQVLELQKNIVDATGRQLMLTNAEREHMLQINRLVGSDVNNKFMDEMMNKMGAQLSTVGGAVSKAYATGAKSGLSAAQLSKKVADNLSMANRLAFRDGINGLIRMTALSEKLGISMQAVESAASKFMDLDSSIETSARLQMLGGSSAVFGGNPLEMMYEANYDPEAFSKRLSDSLASYATFDVSKGMATINGGNMMFVKEMANAMGISVDEASAMAKKNAEIKYKEQAFGPALARYGEYKDFILNKSYVDAKTGHLMMNDVNRNKVDISKGELTQGIIDEMTKFEGMSDSELMKSQAQSLISIDEMLEGTKTSFFATIAEKINDFAPELTKFIQDFGKKLVNEIAPKVAMGVVNLYEWFKKHSEIFKKIYNFIEGPVMKVIGWMAENIEIMVALWASSKLIKFGFGMFQSYQQYKFLAGLKGLQGGTQGAAMAASGGASGASFGSKVLKALKTSGSWLLNGAISLGKSIGNGIKSGAENAVKLGGKLKQGAIKWGGKIGNKATVIKDFGTRWGGKLLDFLKANGGKIVGKVGTAAGIGYGLYEMYQGGKALGKYNDTIDDLKSKLSSGKITQEEYDKLSRDALIEKRTAQGGGAGAALGGTIGAIFGGTQGAALGATVGSFIGKGIGSVYTSIEEGSKEFWNGPVKDFAKNAFGDVGVGLVDGIGTAVGGATSAIGGYIEDSLTNFSDTLDGLGDGFSKIIHGDFIGGVKTIGESLVKCGYQVVTGVPKMLWGILKGIGEGFWQFIKGLWKGITGWFDNAVDSAKSFFAHPIDTISGWFSKGSDAVKSKISKMPSNGAVQKFDDGGIVGGNSYHGDKVYARVNSGEMVLNKLQQTTLFGILTSVPNFVSGLLTNKNDVKAKPVGGKEYVYTPNGSETSRVGGNTVTVKDFNINLSGTIKLDGGNFSKDIDSSALLNDMSFMNKIKDIIKDSINSDMYSGRYMNDTSTLRGHATPSSVLRR